MLKADPLLPPKKSGATTGGLLRRDRTAAALSALLELYHANERVRVDGEEKDDIGDAAREGLMLACRGLAEYVSLQARVG